LPPTHAPPPAFDARRPRQDDKLLEYGHHFPQAFDTIHDEALQIALGGDASFVFSREVDGCDL
jgi:hypothetical protein